MVAFEDFQSKPGSSEADAGILFPPQMLITVVFQITEHYCEFGDLAGRSRLGIFHTRGTGRELEKAQGRKWYGQRNIPSTSLCFDMIFMFGVREEMV